jgi:hypothetical protein
MAGQAQPPRLVEPFAKNATTCTPSAPVAGGRTFPFPTPSQVGITNGAASLDDGFTAANMTDPAAGGIPPFGVDMNGILFYLSSWCAYLGAGQLPQYDATLQTAIGGYAIGTVLAKAAAPYQTWASLVDANMTDPDTGGAGWVSSTPLYSAAALTGPNDVVLPGASDYIIDVSLTAGNVTFTGFVAQRDGQRITLSCVGSGTNLLNLSALTGSGAGNQIRLITGGQSAIVGQSITLQYSQGAGVWIPV